MEKMIAKIEKLQEISGFLNIQDYALQLSNLKAALEKSEYMLSVMGQFSAGKSRLINNLIGKTVLPVHITETTAVITFIRYSENEYAEILYTDQTSRQTDIADTLSLWQSGSQDEIARIQTIVLYVNSSLLKNGLIIVDTPGINTIISRHIQLTTEILNASHRILYVLGKPLAQSDLEFLGDISGCGLPLMFARTHMDEMHAGEENVEVSISKERKKLEEYTEDEVFFLSNEEEDAFYQNVSRLHAYLMNNLAADTKKALMSSVRAQIDTISCQLQKEIAEKKEQLTLTVSGNQEKYTQKKQKNEEMLRRMEEILEVNRKKVRDKTQQLKSEAKQNMNEARSAAHSYAEKQISALQAGDNMDAWAAEAERCVKDGFGKMYYAYVGTFERFISANSEELEADFTRTGATFDVDAMVPDNLNEASQQLAEIEGKMEALLLAKQELAAEIESLQTQKAGALIDQKSAEETIQTLQENLKKVQSELNEYPEYEQQYVVVQEADHKVENVMRKIGSAADWALLLLPGKVMVNGAAQAAKAGAKLIPAIGKVLPKAGKVAAANIGAKAAAAAARMNNSKNLVKAAKNVDKFLDVGRVMHKGVNGLDVTEEKKTSILDYFTLEYYMGKLGRKFDKPEICEIDHEYEKRYFEEKRRIQEQVKLSSEAELRKRIELLDIRNEVEKAELEEKIRRTRQQAADSELQRLTEKLEQEKNIQRLGKIRSQYIQGAHQKLDELSEYILRDVAGVVDQKLNDYVKTCNFSVMPKIQRKRNEIAALDAEFNQADKTCAREMLNTCAKYEELLSGILES